MVITGKGVRLLKQIAAGDKFEKGTEEARVLELAGILRFELPGYYSLTYTGESLVELIKSIESKGVSTEEWEDKFRFVGSEVIAMVDSIIKAGGRIPEDFEAPLAERGLAKDGALTEEGEELWEIYRLARPQLVVNQELTKLIKRLPVGPVKKTGTVDVDDEYVKQLEAQRLIAFSMPPADFFTFTGLGQKIKEALEKGAQPFPVAVSVDILLAVKRAKESPQDLSENDIVTLQAMAYVDDNLELLPAGEALYMAYKLYNEGSLLLTPSIVLSDDDVEVLFAVDELWKKYKENPEIFPSPPQIREYISKVRPAIEKDTMKILYSLECFGILTSEEGPKNKLVYVFTPWGKKVLEDQKDRRRPISSPAVKCITITRKEFSAPGVDWYQAAQEEGLVGTYGPTKSGTLYANLAVSIDRLPHITDYEMEVLSKISDVKPLYLREYMEKYNEEGGKKVKKAIEMLDAKGFVEILPTDIVVLTEAGVYMKRALSGVTSGFGNPVTPHLYRVLQAIREVGTLYERERKIRVRPDRWKKVEKLSGLDPETFSEVVRIARMAKFLGTNTLTHAGYYLLLALDELRKAYGEAKKWFYSQEVNHGNKERMA